MRLFPPKQVVPKSQKSASTRLPEIAASSLPRHPAWSSAKSGCHELILAGETPIDMRGRLPALPELVGCCSCSF